jgi:hypothetical protein
MGFQSVLCHELEGILKIHTSRKAHLVIVAAWLVHVVAWFVPVIKGGDVLPQGLPGWEAFRVAASAVWRYQDFDRGYIAVLCIISAATTMLFLLGSLWVVLYGSSAVWRVSAWLAACAFVINSHWYLLSGPDRKDLRIGYFLWWFSYGLLALGIFLQARHLQLGSREVRLST